MILFIFTLLLVQLTELMPITIFDFNKDANISNWYVVDDIVMGGRSYGRLLVDREGNGIFKGNISLENNGGFSSVRYRFKRQKVDQYKKLVLYLKGDGKKYQVRIKENSQDYYSYIYTFQTTRDWEKVELDFNKMYPVFRGRRLNMENYLGKYMQEIGFLIANKKAENFRLVIDKIELK